MMLAAADAIKEDYDWGTLTWFASQQVGNSTIMTVGECVIKAGCANPRHSHPNCEEILNVRSGRIIHSLGDKTFEMRAGDTITIPPDTVHNAENIGTDEATLFIVFSTGHRQTDMD